jgi:hypothetical protein
MYLLQLLTNVIQIRSPDLRLGLGFDQYLFGDSFVISIIVDQVFSCESAGHVMRIEAGDGENQYHVPKRGPAGEAGNQGYIL